MAKQIVLYEHITAAKHVRDTVSRMPKGMRTLTSLIESKTSTNSSHERRKSKISTRQSIEKKVEPSLVVFSQTDEVGWIHHHEQKISSTEEEVVVVEKSIHDVITPIAKEKRSLPSDATFTSLEECSTKLEEDTHDNAVAESLVKPSKADCVAIVEGSDLHHPIMASTFSVSESTNAPRISELRESNQDKVPPKSSSKITEVVVKEKKNVPIGATKKTFTSLEECSTKLNEDIHDNAVAESLVKPSKADCVAIVEGSDLHHPIMASTFSVSESTNAPRISELRESNQDKVPPKGSSKITQIVFSNLSVPSVASPVHSIQEAAPSLRALKKAPINASCISSSPSSIVPRTLEDDRFAKDEMKTLPVRIQESPYVLVHDDQSDVDSKSDLEPSTCKKSESSESEMSKPESGDEKSLFPSHNEYTESSDEGPRLMMEGKAAEADIVKPGEAGELQDSDDEDEDDDEDDDDDEEKEEEDEEDEEGEEGPGLMMGGKASEADVVKPGEAGEVQDSDDDDSDDDDSDDDDSDDDE